MVPSLESSAVGSISRFLLIPNSWYIFSRGKTTAGLLSVRSDLSFSFQLSVARLEICVLSTGMSDEGCYQVH